MYCRVHVAAEPLTMVIEMQKYAGLEQFVKDWLAPADLVETSDVPALWQSVIASKVKIHGRKDASTLMFFSPEDFINFLMIVIVAYKKLKHISTRRSLDRFLEVLVLDDRHAIQDRLRTFRDLFTRRRVAASHDNILKPPQGPTQAPPFTKHPKNFAKDLEVAGELHHKYLYARLTKEEAAWHHNPGVSRALHRDGYALLNQLTCLQLVCVVLRLLLCLLFVRSKRPTSPLDLDTWEPQRPYIDLSFGVEIGKTYHVRLGIKFSRPKEAVVDDDEDLEGFEWSKQVCVWCIPLATSGRNLTLGAFAACIDDHVVYRSRGTPSGTERRCRSGDSS